MKMVPGGSIYFEAYAAELATYYLAVIPKLPDFLPANEFTREWRSTSTMLSTSEERPSNRGLRLSGDLMSQQTEALINLCSKRSDQPTVESRRQQRHLERTESGELLHPIIATQPQKVIDLR